MTATLKLKDSTETVDLLDTTKYKLDDNSFKISNPQRIEKRIEDNFYAGRDLQRLEYGTRQVSFDVRAVGSTRQAVSTNISAIQRLITRASSMTYLQGGDYNQTVTYTEGSETGDQGVVLQLRRGSDSISNITSEYTNSSIAVTGIYTMRVISGDLEITDNIFGSADKTSNSTTQYYKQCTVTLEVEPFILGPSRILSTLASAGYENEPYYGNSQKNRLIISAASIPGEAEALTRIVTQLNNAQGIIIARDAGISLLNCPSYPTLSTGKDDVFVYGQIQSTSNLSYKININGTGTPNTFRFSADNGSTWGATTNIVAWTPIQLSGSGGAINAYAVFGSTTGFTSGQTWTFSNHQSYIRNTGSAVDFYDNRANFMGDSGHIVYQFYINVPPGCRSRYKVVAQMTSDLTCEYRMKVGFLGRGASGDRVETEPQFYEWVGPFGSRMIDFGLIDLTSMTVPFMSHPYSATVLSISIYARTSEEILTDSGDDIIFSRGYLVPAQDEFAYMQAAWKNDGSGFEVYSNYDAGNPYIAEENISMMDATSIPARISIGLDATYGGNVITLVPNVDQTLLFVPLLSVSTDWRSASIPSNGDTGDTYVAIRPRYLHVPG